MIKLRKGKLGKIQTDVYPGHEFTGLISLISVQADVGRKYDVEVEVPIAILIRLKQACLERPC